MPYQSSGKVTDLAFGAVSTNAKFAELEGTEVGFSVAGKGEIYRCRLSLANGVITAGDFCGVIDDGDVDNLTSALVTEATGTIPMSCGVACATTADNEYFWLCVVKSDSSDTSVGLNTASSCANDVILETTSTAGQLDDANVNAAGLVSNLQLDTDTGTAAVNTDCRWDRPMIINREV